MTASKHLPEVSGALDALVPATGTLVVDTGLRDMAMFTCALAQDSVATAASVSWEKVAQEPGGTQKVTLKTWAADGAAAGSTAALVSWTAIGN